MKKLISNTCSGCAGEIKFEPKQQCLKCSYCENTFEIKESISNAEKYPYNESSAIKLSKDKYSQCICKSCDKTFFILNDNKNLSCPYCGGGEVDGAFDIAEVPDGIVPFKLNKDEALQSFLTWVKKKKFVPNGFKNQVRSNFLKGVYLPVYSYDFVAKTKFSGYRTTTRYYDGKSHTTRTYIKDKKDYKFNNYLDSANSIVSVISLREVSNYDFSSLCVFRTEYLYGFLGLSIDKNLHTSCGNMKNEAINDIKNFIRRDYGRDIQNLKVEANFLDVKYNYLYVPLYVTSYNYKDKDYYCYINGQTGKINGKAPKSFWKYFFFISGLFIGMLGLAMFAFHFM